jgi:prolyl 4-hydroxylase
MVTSGGVPGVPSSSRGHPSPLLYPPMDRFCCTTRGLAPFCDAVAPINEYPGLRKVYDEPPIYLVPDFLSSAECDALICASFGRLQPAHVVGRGDGATNSFGYRQGRTPGRTSRTCTLSKVDTAATVLMDKAVALTSKPATHMELPQVGCYTCGQFYSPHYDAVEHTAPAARAFLANGGQRVITLLVYLSNTQHGSGCTSFPLLRACNAERDDSGHIVPPATSNDCLRIKPREGTALLFFPASASGRLDTRVLHSSEPTIGSVTKWVSQIFMREHGNRRDAEPSKQVLPVAYDRAYEGRSVAQWGFAPAETEAGADDSHVSSSDSGSDDSATARAVRGIQELLAGTSLASSEHGGRGRQRQSGPPY